MFARNVCSQQLSHGGTTAQRLQCQPTVRQPRKGKKARAYISYTGSSIRCHGVTDTRRVLLILTSGPGENLPEGAALAELRAGNTPSVHALARSRQAWTVFADVTT